MLWNKNHYPEHLQEIIDFALEAKVLFASTKPDDLDVVVVKQPPKDWSDAGPDGKDYWETNENEFTFRDITQEERCSIIEELCNDKEKNRLDNHIIKFLMDKKKLYKRIEKKLKNRIKDADIYADYIQGDILSCAEWRICFGRKEGFWEDVFRIYKSGGMPVGWSGNYPDGRFMVLYPGLKISS